MKYIKTIVAASGLAFGLLNGVGEAQGETVSYTSTLDTTPTDINTSLSLAKFNTTLGTLQSVTITLSSTASTIITVTNSASTESSGSVYTSVKWTLTDPFSLFGNSVKLTVLVPDEDGITYSLEPSGSVVTPLATASGSSNYTFNTANILSEFSDAAGGLISLGLNSVTKTTLTNTGGNTGAVQATNANAVATVTYTYNPIAVPEPSSLWMAFCGIGALAFIHRLRRRF